MIQFDEPAFNVYMDAVKEWGVAALERAAEGLACKTAVHICYGYGIQANIDWKGTLGSEWRQYEETFPALATSRIDQVSLECRNARVPMALMRLLAGKDVLVGVIDVATDRVETPEEVADTIAEALSFVPPERLFPCTNCGMAPMRRDVAEAKLAALGAGAALARRRLRGVGCAEQRTRRNDDPDGEQRGRAADARRKTGNGWHHHLHRREPQHAEGRARRRPRRARCIRWRSWSRRSRMR